MSDQQKWTGQTIAGKYVLGKFLGGTEHGATFVTEIAHARAQQVAIKLIKAEGVDSARQLARWKELAGLSHANLLKILDFGKCQIESESCLFVVTEYADENLAEILTQRPLTAEETRGMIEPVLDTLEFLHGQKLVHTRLHPGNILAIGDRIKLSSDSAVCAGETIGFGTAIEGFSAPEWGKGGSSNALDVWSLGATLAMVLTQRSPEIGTDGEARLTGEMVEPFAAIVQGCLKIDTQQRLTLNGVKAKLNPGSVVETPAAPQTETKVSVAPVQAKEKAPVKKQPKPPAIDPLTVPLSKIEPQSASERRTSPAAIPADVHAESKRSYWMLVAAAVLIAAVWISLPKLMHREAGAASSELMPATKAAAEEKHNVASAENSKTTMTMPKKSVTPEPAAAKVVQPIEKATPPIEKATSKAKNINATRGEVLDQVLPEVSDKARATIQGRVRISVRVQVNSTGTVDTATIDGPANSKYFAEQALKAAKLWQFSAPEGDGHSLASEWLLHFEITTTATTARATQVSP